MKPHRKNLIPLIAIGALAFFLNACGKPEGPAEKAGKEVDKAMQSAGEKVDKAMQSTGEKVEQVGEKIQEKAKDASK